MYVRILKCGWVKVVDSGREGGQHRVRHEGMLLGHLQAFAVPRPITYM